MAAAVAAIVPSGREADAYGRCLGASIARIFSMDIALDETQHMELTPIPGSFICPISNDVIDDPVATVDGNIYERMYIKRWFQERRQRGLPITSPATGLELASTFVLPVVALKRAIETYIQHRPEFQPAAAEAPAAQAAPAPKWPSKAEGYELTTKIGNGAFAVVRKAVIKEGAKKGAEVAVKIIEFEEFVESNLEEIRRELQWMRTCRHENVIAYHMAVSARQQMWLVMPLLAGGSCANVMRSRKAMGGFDDLSIVAYILRETAKAVKYFHDNQQIHRDLKAGNILLSDDGKVFLSDFGVPAFLRHEVKRKICAWTPPCWTAPEVLMGNGYDYKADIWSFGITAIELAYGEAPYQQLPYMKVMKTIIEKDPPRIDKRKWDALFVALIECCLQKDPRKRATMEDIFAKHQKFFAKANEQPLADILSSLPPIEQRMPRMQQRSQVLDKGAPLDFRNTSRDFRKDDHDDGEDPLGHLSEDEGEDDAEDPLGHIGEDEGEYGS